MFYVVMDCIFVHFKGLISGGSIITLITIVPYSFVPCVNMLPQMTLKLPCIHKSDIDTIYLYDEHSHAVSSWEVFQLNSHKMCKDILCSRALQQNAFLCHFYS